MKRTAFLWALLLAAVFILPADAATYEAEGLFRLRYDEAAYTLDDQTYAYESETGASRWFFVLYRIAESTEPMSASTQTDCCSISCGQYACLRLTQT